ncbi:DUF4097 family beta strand repeat-containing protein [Thalassotalea psychrophila]|uniref:DUF4097 family beta strand repeat-containing protein n=1 Tax=Thalassotalea psychrophila TaxID=3065647 RepID=A0ABY9TSI5_9GAMM|nr:DUF4097 family beta strand repeat-containing protein [Colwelliaceae bacterium SQ149]
MKFYRNTLKNTLATLKISGAIFLLALAIPALAKDVDQKLAVSENANISIDNLRGKVVIKGTATNQVWVTGKLDDKATDFILKADGDNVIVQVKMPAHMNNSFWDHDEQETDIVIEVPKGAKISFQGVSSDIKISNVNNDVRAKTVSGDVILKQLNGNRVDIETVSGDIDTKSINGRISLSAVSGDIKDDGSAGRLEYYAVSGDIDVNSTAEEVVANVISGDLEIRLNNVIDAELSSVSGNVVAKLELNDDGLLEMSSVSGNLDLVLQENVNASVKVDSHAGGRITNKLTDDKVEKAKYGPHSKLSTQAGSGSASVKMSTVSGNVKLHY